MTKKKNKNERITVKIIPDDCPESPRTAFDSIGKTVCFHRRYDLGDKHGLKKDDFSGWDELSDYLEKEEKALVILPLYLYDHSGITISTSPFSCPWDSGQVGFIYATAESVTQLCGPDHELLKDRGKLVEALKQEIKTYDQYLRGDVYGFIVEKICNCGACGQEDREVLDSCSGFYGDDHEKSGLLENIPAEYKKYLPEHPEVEY